MVFVTERNTGILLPLITTKRMRKLQICVRVLSAMHSKSLDFEINALALCCQAGGNIDVSPCVSTTESEEVSCLGLIVICATRSNASRSKGGN
ncbi:hypothetical protein AH0331V1_1749 [Klebsiella pneumoniae]|nr:hypothetical protein AH0331V1_1749 [Klebsiella pneumoniae]